MSLVSWKVARGEPQIPCGLPCGLQYRKITCEPVLYYLKDGPKRGFVREELQIGPPGTELSPEGIR
ncbi:hypothetical protein pdam_00014318 [Pocillopora damicornis]|uniref:Uncharacterized protein n=1 Tax=Pocillopora damicornis TaxID=46731 RepID=A0A3M6U4T7_POCDA|nr:hypothetical protein pdam_00014318 [Pocillopora damicornis]